METTINVGKPVARGRLAVAAAILSVLLTTTPSRASALRVDLNPPEQRKDILTPGWENWAWTGGPSDTRTFDGVSVTIRALSDGVLSHVWYKGLLDHQVTMASDGVSVSERSQDGGIEIVITGLRPGQHSLATFHNEVRNVEPATFDVFLGDELKVRAVTATVRATNEYDVATAYVEFNAEAGKNVLIRFRPSHSDSNGTIVINGFELDAPAPARRASKPSPANDDEHVDADGGSARLSWVAPPSAVSHDVYFGTNSEAVAVADRKSSLFKGSHKSIGFSAGNLNHLDTYFWRIDEIDAPGNVTKGEVWRFRTRHPAFPSAEGYGRFARGGRGGRVIAVTNLNDSGFGSLRAAVEAEGPRTVVFNVSGLITLQSRLVIRNPYLTIAGQTAPSNGICIRKFNLGLGGTHDVIVRYIRVRPGNISGQTLDGMGMAGSDHCVIDHCSISWSLDEAFSSRSAKNITLQRTLISEALNEAGHRKYRPGTQHGYAASIGGLIGSFHHNLLAHCAGRNWSLAGGLNQSGRHTGWLDIRNNVVYNWRNRTTDGGAEKVNFVNNYYKPGPASTLFTELNPQFENPAFGPQIYYVEGNVMEGQHGPEGPTGPFQGVRPRPDTPWQAFTVATPFFDSHVKTRSAQESYENVLSNVGCNFPAPDAHDRRIIEEVRQGTFKYRGSKTGLPGLPDSQDDVGGWEHYPVVHRPADWDADHDGMPDDWEKRAGLDPKNPADGNEDRDGDGYPNLEEYLGWLVGEFPEPKTSAAK